MLQPTEIDPRRRACEELAQGLRRELARRGLTQARLARAVGTHRDNISGYCAGQSFPRAALLRRIAQALDCPVEELVPSLAGRSGAHAAASPGTLSAALEADGAALVRIDARVPPEVAAQLLTLLAPYLGGSR
jgi:transcriptional regulator with XRE-family HTH domain